jgi:hypothetical protein
MDQGTSFMSKRYVSLLNHIRSNFSIHPHIMLRPMDRTSSNRTLISLIKKKISDHPKNWHKVLSEALWAHRISKYRVSKVSPFELVYR